MKSTVYNCNLLSLPKINYRAGNITVVENNNQLPFDVKRVFYIYDVPGGANRGGHAHKELDQLIVAVSGFFEVLLNDGTNKKNVQLSMPNKALHIPPGVWAELHNFSSGAVCLVLASDYYDKDEYIYCFEEFMELKKKFH